MIKLIQRACRELPENYKILTFFEVKLYSQAQEGTPFYPYALPWSGLFPSNPFPFDDLPKFNWVTVDGV